MIISKANVRQLRTLLAPHRGSFSLLLILAAIQALVFSAADPLTIKFLIDAITDANLQLFAILAAVVILVATAGRLLMYASALIRKRLKNAFQEALTIELSGVFYQHAYQRLAQRGRGYYISRLHDEPKQLSSVIDTLEALVSSIFICITGLAVAIWISWQITLALIVIVPVLWFFSNKYSRKIAKSTKAFQETEAEFKSILSGIIDSYKYVRQFSLQHTAAGALKQGLHSPLSADFNQVRFSARYQTLSGVFLAYAELAVIVVAGFKVIMGLITIGSLFALTRAFGMIIQAVQQLSTLVPKLAILDAQLDRLAEFRAEAERQQNVTPANTAATALVAFQQVSFGYQQPILNNLSLQISPKERILLAGGNGTGKSTIAHLIAGYLQPHSGQLYRPHPDNISALLYPFGVLPGSFGQNVQYLQQQGVCAEKISNLLERLDLNNCLETAPADMSEGQRKRCQIALCLLKSAELYILDEPLANIDDESKNTICQLIVEYTSHASLLMIMHEGKRFASVFNRTIQLEHLTEPQLLRQTG
ncbi:hypothetical protein WG68_07970 [Arsukibacterium ikkense]|uniref:ABC transporter ATP-binding protein n=1 Tax=Arsukibacterium ikkense TaxID=336831 RepID=A0A0M2V691_9GAMM|nr:ABC transporter ATP-binding protein [Arsukibacterium ikkense]KKO45934.1 hypothetical protein WG68_07970 [Arsukibacterium ikkense]